MVHSQLRNHEYVAIMDMDDVDIFELLDADESETIDSLKSKCQNLLLKHHPDKNAGLQSDVFQSVQAAWKLLSNPQSWRRYLAERSVENDSKPTWKQILLSEMRNDLGMLTFTCRCGGEFAVSEDEVESLLMEPSSEEAAPADELILECDTCSLEISVQLTPTTNQCR